MQNQEHTTRNTAESAATAPSGKDPKKRGRLVTFFTKLYSPHGTLTCEEFIGPAVYLLTLGTIVDGLMRIPLETLAFSSPLRDTHVVLRVLVALYATGQHIVLFLYPQYNIYRKLLKNTPFKGIYYNALLVISFICIYTHSYFWKEDTLCYTIL